MSANRAGIIAIFVASALICAWDVYAALHGHGNTALAWIFAVVMGFIAIWSLNTLYRGSSSKP